MKEKASSPFLKKRTKKLLSRPRMSVESPRQPNKSFLVLFFKKGLLAFLLLTEPAAAQLSPAAKMSQVAANQLGIVEYCQAHGLASAAAVRAEREAIEGAPSPALSTARAEALGRLGFSVAPDGQQIPVALMASQQGMTVAALCHDLAASSLSFQAAVHPVPDTRKP